jgi:hypothetical protein
MRPARARVGATRCAGIPARARDACVGRSHGVLSTRHGRGRGDHGGTPTKQLARERAERERAERAASEDDAEAHARRAEKTAYLRERLEQRARAEREGDSEAEDGSARPEP